MKAPKLHILGVLHLSILFLSHFIISAQSPVTLSSSIGTGADISLCEGESIHLLVSGGNASYTFEFFSINASGTMETLQARSSQATHALVNPSSGSIYYAHYYENTSTSNSSPTLTNSLTLTVHPPPNEPEIKANIEGSYYCADQAIAFKASGGAFYTFYVNDILFQASSSLATFTPLQLNGHVVVTAEVSTVQACSALVSTSLEEIVLTGGSITGDQVVFGSQIPEELISIEKGYVNNMEISSLSTVTYQWESALDGEEWHDVLNASQENFQPHNLVESVYFRRKVVFYDSGISCVAYSNRILIQILTDEDETCAADISVTLPFVQDVILCNPAVQGAIRLEITGGRSDQQQIRWEQKAENGNWLALPHLNDLTYPQSLSAGVYRAQLTALIRSGLTSCTLHHTTQEITIREQNLAIVSSTVSNDASTCYETQETGVLTFQLENTVTLQNSSQTILDEPVMRLNDQVIPSNSPNLNYDPVHFLYTLRGLSPGQHALKIESSTANFCAEELFFEIEEISPIQFSGQQTYVADPCGGTAQIAVDLDDIQGGIPFDTEEGPLYDLFWVYVPDEDILPAQTVTQTFIGYSIPFAQPGRYFLKIRDQNNCVFEGDDTLTIEVSNDEVTAFEIRGILTDESGDLVTVLNDGCLDNAEFPGTIGIEIANGVGPYSIQWSYKPLQSNQAFVPLNNFTNAVYLQNLIEGRYKLEVRSLLSDCTTDVSPSPYYYTQEFLVESKAPVILQSPPIFDRDLCQGKAGNIIVEIFNNLHEELLFKIGDEVLDVIEIVEERYYRLLVETPFTEEVLEIGNIAGCVLERIPINIAIGDANFFIDAASNLENNRVRLGEEVTFFNTSKSPYVRSEWNFGDGSDRIERDIISEAVSPTTHRFLTEGSFLVQLKTFNAAGCFQEVSQQVHVGKGYSIHAPNAFTPNDDFVNDRFRPLITGFVQANLSIYDYNGNLLYVENIKETDDQNPVGIAFQGWNGSVEGAGYKMYLYTMTGYLQDETEVQDSGTFILIK